MSVRRCLKRRLPEIEALRRELAAWRVERNRLGTSLDWRFTLANVRTTLRKFCPSVEP